MSRDVAAALRPHFATRMPRDDDNDNNASHLARRTVDYTHLWPIALAPVIPSLGLALRAHPDPKIRLGAPAAVACAILVGAHGFALNTSTDTK